MLQRHYHNKNGIEGCLEEKKCRTYKTTSSNVALKIGTEKKTEKLQVRMIKQYRKIQK